MRDVLDAVYVTVGNVMAICASAVSTVIGLFTSILGLVGIGLGCATAVILIAVPALACIVPFVILANGF